MTSRSLSKSLVLGFSPASNFDLLIFNLQVRKLTFFSPSICGLSHRRRLICHVREYNRTVDPRRRFYMLNLSNPELAALHSNPRLPNGRLIRPRYEERVRVATDGIMDAIWDGEAYRDESFVNEKVMDCLKSFEGAFKDDQYVGRVEEDVDEAGSGARGEEGDGGREQGVQEYFMARHGEYVLAGEFARLRMEDEARAASIVLPPNYRGHNRDPDSF
jgi:hypothetical protein